jgi:Fibronectin type III domain
MADFGLGSLATGRVEAWENWNNSYQTSMHFKLSCEIRGGAYNAYGPTAGPYYDLWHVGAGYWTYTSNGWRTVREGDATFTKDANGNVSISISGYLDGKNSPYVTAGSAAWTHYPARIGIAPTMNNPVASNISVATATISGTNANNGLGTSTTVYLRYKKSAEGDGSYVQQQTTSWNLTGLTPGTQYTIQIYGANNNGDTNGWQNTQTFTTLPAPANSTAMLRIIGVL